MKKITKEKIYGERGRKWRSSVEPNWFKRNKVQIVIALCVVVLSSIAWNI